MSNSENDNTIKIPADKLIEALFHAKQCEQHYATQESVDNLKESVNYRFDAVDKRFSALEGHVDKRFDDLNQNLSNLKNLLIVFSGAIFTAVIGLILKGYIG
ncbi:hypothetical protein ACN08N_00505 (plasmid) [Photobacterium leiognathi subsp. mandapamensis]|uniref:hypothetical protein n=1 Tax=Photobacterium leiognathi TaxID=553611 RepID=UPI003AF3F022